MREKYQRNAHQLPPSQGIKPLTLGACPDQGLDLENVVVWDDSPAN